MEQTRRDSSEQAKQDDQFASSFLFSQKNDRTLTDQRCSLGPGNNAYGKSFQGKLHMISVDISNAVAISKAKIRGDTQKAVRNKITALHKLRPEPATTATSGFLMVPKVGELLKQKGNQLEGTRKNQVFAGTSAVRLSPSAVATPSSGDSLQKKDNLLSPLRVEQSETVLGHCLKSLKLSSNKNQTPSIEQTSALQQMMIMLSPQGSHQRQLKKTHLQTSCDVKRVESGHAVFTKRPEPAASASLGRDKANATQNMVMQEKETNGAKRQQKKRLKLSELSRTSKALRDTLTLEDTEKTKLVDVISSVGRHTQQELKIPNDIGMIDSKQKDFVSTMVKPTVQVNNPRACDDLNATGQKLENACQLQMRNSLRDEKQENALKSKSPGHRKSLSEAISSTSKTRLGTIKVIDLYRNAQRSSLISEREIDIELELTSQTQFEKPQMDQTGMIRAQQASPNHTANFERLSCLISQTSRAAQRRQKLLTHLKRLQQQRKESEAWQRATSGLFQNNIQDDEVNELKTAKTNSETIESVLSSKLIGFESCLRNRKQSMQENLVGQLMFLRVTPSVKPQIAKLLGRNPEKRRKHVFSISQDAVTFSSRILIDQLLAQLSAGDSSNGRCKNQVSALKQSCLIQFILDEWASTTNGVLRHFSHFCTFTDSLQVLSQQAGATETEAYSVILFGRQTPISHCCRQLICFQFAKCMRSVTVFCLEPGCRKSKLESRPLSREIFHTIFLTQKRDECSNAISVESQRRYSYSQLCKNQDKALVGRKPKSAHLENQRNAPMRQPHSSSQTRKKVFLALQ